LLAKITPIFFTPTKQTTDCNELKIGENCGILNSFLCERNQAKDHEDTSKNPTVLHTVEVKKS